MVEERGFPLKLSYRRGVVMELDNLLNEIITAAYNEAKLSKHEYFTPEHILYASLFFEEGKNIIEYCGGNIEELKVALSDFLSKNILTVEKIRTITNRWS